MANAPGRSSGLDAKPTTANSTGGVPAATVPGEELLPQNIIRRCSKCAAPLTVAERMFYFLEAIDAPPLCRPCLVQASRSQPSPLPPLARGGPADRAPTLSSSRPLPSESPVDTAIRIYLREELERAKLTLLHVPETDPRAQAIRGLYQDAFQQLSSDRLLDAIITVRDLRETIAVAESPGAAIPAVPGTPPAAPTGPTLESTDAAAKRARELGLHPSSSSGDTSP